MPQYIRTFPNALTAELCEKLMEAFDRDGDVAPDPQPDYSTRQFIYASDKPRWADLLYPVGLISNDLLSEYFTNFGPDHWFDDGYVMAKYAPGDTLALHDDGQCPDPPHNGLRLVTLLYYLNDAEGGETYFPNQKVKVKPKQGTAVIFPAMLTHPHEVLEAKSPRYILQTWIIDPDLVVHYRGDDDPLL